jgi:hypothetical protein
MNESGLKIRFGILVQRFLALVFLVFSFPALHGQTAKKVQPAKPVFQIGQEYGGGIIFYIDSTGQHGLIAAPMDQTNKSKWGCLGTDFPDIGTKVGSGKRNTQLIVKACKDEGNPARICDDLILNNYSDWFLPSKDELVLMYNHRNLIGGFAGSPYWSSSSFNPYYAWLVYFRNGYTVYTDKYYAYCVRAIRAF